MQKIPSHCPICSGKVALGTTTFTVDMKSGVVVVRNVPAFVCQQCGEEWLDDEQSAELEKIVSRARNENAQLEMISMS
jgi:YgiT-type zinc finger domain-containing protein